MDTQVRDSTMVGLRLHPDSPPTLRFESQPIPQILHPDDAIVKVSLAGLCGSDLHAYRGLEPFDSPFIMGHEFVGKIVALGSNFGSGNLAGRPSLYATLKLGDKVRATQSPGDGTAKNTAHDVTGGVAFHFILRGMSITRACRTGFTSRCKHSLLFGSALLPGAQAQYVRVPHAGGTLFKFPPDNASSSETITWSRISDASLILLGDILPTGYFAALQAVQHPNLAHVFARQPFPVPSASLKASTADAPAVKLQGEDCALTIALVGLGPVGLCALVSLVELLGLAGISDFRIVAVDPNPVRRQTAELVAQALDSAPGGIIRVVSLDDAVNVASDLSDQYGCDAVLEIVGNNSALELAYRLIRPFGVISSVGVHTHPQFPINGGSLYSKNASLLFGRCPVRSIFPYCIELLQSRQNVFSVGGSAGIIEKIVPFEELPALDAYELFNAGKCGKILFQMTE